MLNMILFTADWLYKEKVYRAVHLVFFCSLTMNIHCAILLLTAAVAGASAASDLNEDKQLVDRVSNL